MIVLSLDELAASMMLFAVLESLLHARHS